MSISEEAARELRTLAASEEMRKDMRILAENRHNPFVKDGVVDVDAYIRFVTEYNEFINHEPKPFKPMKDHNMRL